MARRIIWLHRAQKERKAILAYWKKRNQSPFYSQKLNLLFKIATQMLVHHPLVGRATDKKNIRVKLVRDYLLYYEIKDEEILILSIKHIKQVME